MAILAEKPLQVDEATYRKRIRAWTLYDWANSAFATTIMAALLPAYFSSVAGATLPSAATATAYWSLTNSVSLFLIAILSPILGTVSDVMRGKKAFLSVFATLGIIATGLLVLINTGDWLLAALLYVIGRLGFSGSLVFYDALLPHVAKDEDQDRVSAQGYALGYLGGGILLAVNVAMFMLIPDSVFENAGVRLSFLTVAIWWAVFSIPIFRDVPEPPSDTAELQKGETIVSVSFKRLSNIFSELRHYSDLFKFLVAFLIFNDGIGTIISTATIYGAELGFGLTELVLALLMVQFVGIPFSLIFGSLPAQSGNKNRPLFLAFIVYNLFIMPMVGLAGLQFLPQSISGARPAPYESSATHFGQGLYQVTDAGFTIDGTWESSIVTAAEQGAQGFLTFLAPSDLPTDATYQSSNESGSNISFPVHGETFELTYAVGPDHGILVIEVDGEPLMAEGDDDALVPVVLDQYAPVARYGENETFTLPSEGDHTITLINQGTKNEASTGTVTAITSLEVLQPKRVSSLATIIGMVFGTQVVLLGLAWLTKGFFVKYADMLDTKKSILVSLAVYSAIAIWGFFLDSTVEYWFLAWMVAVVQGGSQALSRSLYSAMCPKLKSGEFFGFFSIMEKFASIIGPLFFVGAVVVFGNSRPAILSLIALFIIGGYLLTKVDVEEGKRVAKEADAQLAANQ